jgi:lysine-specific permease
LTVKGFGESEFLFSLIKVLAIIVFIIIGIWMIAKIMMTPNVSTFNTGIIKMHRLLVAYKP